MAMTAPSQCSWAPASTSCPAASLAVGETVILLTLSLHPYRNNHQRQRGGQQNDKSRRRLGLTFDSPLDGGASAAAPTVWKALHAEAPPRLVGGMRLSALRWEPSPAHGGGVWQAPVPPALAAALAGNVSAGAGRVEGEVVELQHGGAGSNRSRMWRARHPNHDPIFPTIWGGGSRRRDCHFAAAPLFADIETPTEVRGGCSRMTVSPTAIGGGYATASGGVGSLPCAFRSPRAQITTPQKTTVDCAIPADRRYPAEPPRGTTSRRRDCHFTDALSPSLLKHQLKGEGGCSRMTVSPTARHDLRGG